jgi:putative endonuclease
VALLLLVLKLYRLRDRNWSCAAGELDLVMERRGTVVFVEVKTRSSSDFGGALGAIDGAKQAQLARVASIYISRHRLWQRPCRFDVIAIERSGRFPGWRVRHVRDAFHPDLGRQV